MPEYKEKVCILCQTVFNPASPKQKYCENCKIEGSRVTARIRDKKRNREKNNYISQTKTCKVCGIEFTTYYTKKNYCGAEECEKIRIYIKNQKTHKRRNKEVLITKGRKYYKENKEKCCLQKSEKYRREHTEAKPYVFGRIYKHNIDDVKKYIEDFGYSLLSEEYKNCKEKITLKCPEGHIWETTFHNFRNNGGITGNRCFYCYINNNYVSRPEKRVREFLETNYPELTIVYNDRKQIAPKELDLYFPDHHLAVEICGLYWHSELSGKKDRRYHYDKTMECFEKGIRLITVFEDELINYFDVVMSRIVQALGITKEKIFARKCELREIDSAEANMFFDKYHIQGKSTAIKAWGLYHDDRLVSVCSVGNFIRKHTAASDSIELKRLCTLPNILVVGGASRLFSAVKKFTKEQGYKKIKSYCDMRYANIFNPIYELLGFKLETGTKYTPHYVKGYKRYRNISLRKTAEERLTNKTEFELRKEQGYDRIWDCGHRSYSYSIQ
jgi:hypothetical protein